MDFLAGLILGYFINKFFIWLNKFAEPKVPDYYTEDDWDWIS
jgi:hypothetical protein